MSLHRQQVVDIIKSWKDMKESDGSFKPIVDIYNSIQPLPSGYYLKYTDDWGPGTVSAVYQQAGIAEIFPCECNYSRMINKAKEMEIWVENDGYKPKLADVCLFDLEDDLLEDNQGIPDQAGIVVSIDKKSKTFVVIIGNRDHEVKSQTIAIKGKFIRGFICPKFDDDPVAMPVPTQVIATEYIPDSTVTKFPVYGTGTLSKIAAGTALNLSKTPVYASPKTDVASGNKSGKYYIWSVDTVNGRVRITNAKEHVGIKGQVTCWINVPDALETVVETSTLSTNANTPTYQVNAVYIVQDVELQVRTGPGTDYPEVKYAELTPNARKYDKNKSGCLCKGAKVTCLDVKVIGNTVWIEIPSGWILAYSNKQYHVK